MLLNLVPVLSLLSVPSAAPPTAPPTAPPSTAVPAPRVSEEPVVIMTDLPSVFPWRHCLLVLAGGAVAASDCAQVATSYQ